MFKAYQLTLTGVAQRLSLAYGLPAATPVGDQAFVAADIPQRQILFQVLTAGSNPVYVGDSALVSATVHGFRVDPADTQQPIALGPFECGPMKLSDFWVLGTNGEVLIIGTVPY